MEVAMRKEVEHLQDNAIALIAHGLNLSRQEIYATNDVAATVERSTQPMDVNIDEEYERRVKTLYSAIVDFASRAGALNLPRDVTDHIYELRDAAQSSVHAVKAVKHMRGNATQFTRTPQGRISEIYNELRTEIARILVEIHKIGQAEPELRSTLWLEEERVQIERDRKNTSKVIDSMIRNKEIAPEAATSFMTDSGYAYEAMGDLIDAAQAYYAETDEAMAEIERILALEEDEIEGLLAEVSETDDAR